MRNSRQPLLIIVVLAALNFLIWQFVIVSPSRAGVYFLDVGQGDSALIILQSGVKILIDGGPDAKIISRLSEVLPFFDRYLDLVVMTHPQLDHYGGLIGVLDNYRVGAFLWNGRVTEVEALHELFEALKREKTKTIVLREGAKIKNGKSAVRVLSPSLELEKSAELNDTSLVLLVDDGFRSLFTADIGFVVEKLLVSKYDLRADVLKVAHHGSKYSSAAEFLENVSPKAAVVSVGKNRYGHPTQEALSRLAGAGTLILRTDRDGTIKASASGGRLEIFRSGRR